VKGPPPPQGPARESGWDPVAAWYDKLVGESGSDYHRKVILPAALRMLALQPGESLVDVCCGQGVLAAPVLAAGAGRYLGVDASPKLIAAARNYHRAEPRVSYQVADVSAAAGDWSDGTFDAAACLMAVHDVADIESMFGNLSRALKVGGRALLVFMHPCFRIPRATHWGWDADQKIQFRRVDNYSTARQIPITTHPGKGGGDQTLFHHRPLATLIRALGTAGLAVVDCEELYSHRRSQAAGPFSRAEHRAAEEIPLFIAFKALKSTLGPASQDRAFPLTPGAMAGNVKLENHDPAP
jgi:ubiquinone/menaquinone biosynthesis C-methylase UbiE